MVNNPTSATPLRLPDVASIEAVLARLDPATADAELIPALTTAFPSFEFSLARIDDDDWFDRRSVIRPDGTRVGELRPWMKAELAKDGGDTKALWRRLKETDLQMTEWHSTSAFVFAPTGQGAADYIQIILGRKSSGAPSPSSIRTIRHDAKSCSVQDGPAVKHCLRRTA